MRCYWVYIMASRSRVIYVGVTNDIIRRVDEHRRGLVPGFTSKCHVTRLVYCEPFSDVGHAIAREKEIKGWLRARKIRLIERRNPTWEDLADRCPREPLGQRSPPLPLSSQSAARACHPERARGTRASEGPACCPDPLSPSPRCGEGERP